MNSYPKKAGIYKLTCSINGKIYIGKSINIHTRLGQHRRCRGVYYFDFAIAKYGWDSFTVEILEIFENFDKSKDNAYLLERESFYIKLFDSANKAVGYNLCDYSTDRTGRKHSDETKMRMSLSHIGKKHTKESKIKMSRSQSGKKLTDEHKEKIRISNLGVPRSKETKNLRKPKSEEFKQNLRKPRSEEIKEKIRIGHLKRKMLKMHSENV
jgi:group I intron endonuclease